MCALLSKKFPSDIDPSALVEPALTIDDWHEFREGIRLFDERRFWHAHEAWENVWKRRPEESRVFFQGIIQLAAAYHLLLVKKRYGGMMGNFLKAEEKLRLFPRTFLGVDVPRLLSAITSARAEVKRIGADHLDEFDVNLLPSIDLPQ